MAGARAVITMDSPAIREVFDESDIMLVPKTSTHAIANAVRALKSDFERRKTLAKSGYAAYQQVATPKVIGGTLVAVLRDVSRMR